MNGKHTPGPWHVCGEQSGVTEYSNTRHIYAQADKSAGGTGCVADVASSTANAALISAAPDMLEALRSAVALLTDPDAGEFEANDVLGELEAAIRKATGGEGGAS